VTPASTKIFIPKHTFRYSKILKDHFFLPTATHWLFFELRLIGPVVTFNAKTVSLLLARTGLSRKLFKGMLGELLKRKYIKQIKGTTYRVRK
jgi:hypothetical protein